MCWKDEDALNVACPSKGILHKRVATIWSALSACLRDYHCCCMFLPESWHKINFLRLCLILWYRGINSVLLVQFSDLGIEQLLLSGRCPPISNYLSQFRLGTYCERHVLWKERTFDQKYARAKFIRCPKWVICAVSSMDEMFEFKMPVYPLTNSSIVRSSYVFLLVAEKFT